MPPRYVRIHVAVQLTSELLSLHVLPTLDTMILLEFRWTLLVSVPPNAIYTPNLSECTRVNNDLQVKYSLLQFSRDEVAVSNGLPHKGKALALCAMH